MTLLDLRLRGAARAISGRPLSAIMAITLLALVVAIGFAAVRYGTSWIINYEFIEEVAPAVIQRSIETFYLLLMSATLFSVLIASIGILYAAADLNFLMAQPTHPARVFALKVGELFINAAGLPLIFTIPVLAGVGAAMNAPPLYYLVSFIAAAALYAIPVTFGSLLALVLVRISPAGRVREIATATSIGIAALALVALRALRPEQILNLNVAGQEEFEAALAAFTRLEIGWLPPAWATNASWHALDNSIHASLIVLITIAIASLATVGALAHLAFTRGWIRSLDTTPIARRTAPRPTPAWERALHRSFGNTGAILTNDTRHFYRDVQQWSQGIVLIALGAVYFLSLSSIPVPTQQFRDVLGMMNIAFVQFLIAGIALRIAYPAVSLEGRAYWLTRTLPIHASEVITAKFIHALPLMLTLGATLGIAAQALLDMSPTLAIAAPIAAIAASIATTALATGIGATFPRYQFSNPNELAATPGALIFMSLALAYAALTTTILARGAWNSLRAPFSNYWGTSEGLLSLALLLAITLIATITPLLIGARALRNAEPDLAN